ncbi:MAG: phosphate ABC transporter substrate-binding protein [Lachnospiraceae bacterium]|nr:phosphate ABC transporter substrate-binding protein [Lachnospiraceae bacterium]
MTGKKRITAGVMAALLLLVFLIGRYDGVWKPHRKSASPYPAQTVVMAGSTSMEKFANMLAECYREANPGVTVTAEFTGSSAGVQAVLSGRADIGLSSRTLTTAEEASGAAAYVIAMDGIAVITDRDNPVTALTTKQLADIYTGQIRDWQELGGRKQPIVVAGREAGSGTRSAFEELLGIEDRCYYANELDSEGAMLARIASTPGAVGYVSFDVLNDTVHALSLDGVEAAAERVKTGSYPLCRSFLLVTKGALEEQSRQVQEIFAYLQTEEGRKLMRDAGLIVSDCHK